MTQSTAPNTGPLYALDGVAPVIHPSAWVAPTAAVMGRVEIGAQASVWFNCVLRGDTNLIRIGARSNVQDGSVLHVNPDDNMACLIGEDVTIGHMALIHGATLHDRAFVGMAATVMDRCVIESGGVLAAGAVLTPGKHIGPNELWAGMPAKLMRQLSPEDVANFALNAPSYVQNAMRFRQGLTRL